MPTSLNTALLTYFRNVLKVEPTSESDVRRLLQGRGVPPKKAQTLAHTIATVARSARTDAGSKPQNPSSETLFELAQALGISLDPLMGHSPPVSALAERNAAQAGKTWLRQFLAHCHGLSCYVVYIQATDLERWRQEALAVLDEDAPQKLATAEAWTKQIKVFDASNRLRREHSLSTDQAVQRQTMHAMIRHRLRWTQKTGSQSGARLARLAREEVLLGIFDTVRDSRDRGKYKRYPSLKGEKLLSLRVSFDTLPSPEGEVGWIVYYVWGPALADDALSELMAIEESSAGTTQTSG